MRQAYTDTQYYTYQSQLKCLDAEDLAVVDVAELLEVVVEVTEVAEGVEEVRGDKSKMDYVRDEITRLTFVQVDSAAATEADVVDSVTVEAEVEDAAHLAAEEATVAVVHRVVDAVVQAQKADRESLSYAGSIYIALRILPLTTHHRNRTDIRASSSLAARKISS